MEETEENLARDLASDVRRAGHIEFFLDDGDRMPDGTRLTKSGQELLAKALDHLSKQRSETHCVVLESGKVIGPMTEQEANDLRTRIEKDFAERGLVKRLIVLKEFIEQINKIPIELLGREWK